MKHITEDIFNEAMNGLDPALVAEHISKREELESNKTRPARTYRLRRAAIAAVAAAAIAAGAAGAVFIANRAPEPGESAVIRETDVSKTESNTDNYENTDTESKTQEDLCFSNNKKLDNANVEKKVYEAGEVIVCRLQFAAPASFDELCVTKKGFEIIGYNTVSADELEITVKYTGKEKEPELCVLLPDNERLFIYGLHVEDRVYVSTYSLDTCYLDYYTELVDSGKMTVTELEKAMSEFEREHDGVEEWGYSESIEDNEALRANNTIAGTIRWRDSSYTYHPLGFVSISLVNADNDSVINSQYVDSDGSYGFITTVSPANGYYIQLKADNSNISVKPYGGTVYTYDSSTYSYARHITINVDIKMTNNRGKAFQVFVAANTPARYADYMNGVDVGKVNVVFPGPNTVSSYNKYTNTISLSNSLTGTPAVYESWDVIAHEYGHHVMSVLGIDNSPGGTHTINTNDIDALNNKSNGIRLSWSESWATVFGELAQQYYSTYLGTIPYVADGMYDSYNGVHIVYETPSCALGDACEDNLICILYDLYDSNNETGDLFAWGHYNFFNRSKNSSSISFSDFTQYIYNNAFVNIFSFGQLLQGANISAGNLTKSSSTTAPTFTWTPGGGNTSLSRNNMFYLVFYKSTGEEIRRFNITTTNMPTTVSYTVNTAEWSNILSQSGSNVIVAVIAYQTNAPTTGGYYSKKYYF